MNPMDPKFLRTHIRRPRNIKRRFSAALALWCAYRKRPAGGCAGAGTHLYRVACGERGWIGLAPSPCPAPLPGRWKGCRGPVLAGFTRMLNQAGMCRGKQGNELLIAERPVQKAADQRRQRRPMPCCSSPLPTKRDAAPRVRSALHRRRPRSSRRRMPARTPALFSSANARTTARLLRGSSFLPPFLCFVFTYFPLYAASRVGKGSSFLLLPSLLPLFAALAFIRTLRLSTQFI